ncbi:MAG TPA: DUF3857 domain-containing transglutaminase family protein, partial [Chthoniobacteraceae bacterium]|nr:DUF3857 domain-containing transglutaminase family protein [Chthoniobacteraceae bacterium]
MSSVVPPADQSRVTIGPAPAWVRVQAADESYRPAGGQPYTHLLLDEQYHAGLREHYTHTVQRLETLGAVRAASQWRFDFDPATQEVVIHSLLVRRAGAAVEHAQPERLRFLQREEQLDRYVMHGQVTVLVLLEDVRPGDILDLSLTTRSRPRLLPDRFWFFVSVPSEVPLRMCRFSIRFPKGRRFAWKAYAPGFAPVIEQAEGETTWRWTMENTVALEPEAQVPTWLLPPLWLQVSDCASWQEVIAAVGGAWQEALDGPELTRKAEEIALAAETLAQRVEKALEFVQDEIRYLSVNIELGGQIPAAPGDVLRRRYGDCKDKSFLLSQLLRRLGVPARPVLVNSLWRQSVQELLPTPDAFDHAVVEYELEGRRYWADATLTLQGGGARNRPVPDLRLGLPLSPGAKGLEPAPPPAAESAYELHETYYLDTTAGPSQLLVQVAARGSYAEELRRALVSEGAEAVAKSREQ